MRGLIRTFGGAALVAASVVTGCGPVGDPDATVDLSRLSPLEQGAAWVADADVRRATLEASIVDRMNTYSADRLAHYAIPGDGWDARPLWAPPVRPVTVDDLGRFADDRDRPSTSAEGVLQPLVLDVDWDEPSLLALGALAFETYPLQVDTLVERTLDDAALAERYGLWTDDRGRVGGLVRVTLPDGREGTSVTCATCHAIPDATGRLEHGRTNARYDRGAIAARFGSGRGAMDGAAWGPGSVDVTADGVVNAAAITDLRAISWQSHLHHAGTLRNGLLPLATRIETLMMTSNPSYRPPREVAFALAFYLWSMDPPATADATERGADLFATHCARCHHADGTTGPPVPLETIGTDAAVGRSTARGTGHWRVPSLRGAGTRTQLLHTGDVDGLDALLDPDRLDRVPGHPFGTSLPAEDRSALADFVRSIGGAR